MTTAVYVHASMDAAQQALVRQAVAGSQVITNAAISGDYTQYVLEQKGARTYGSRIKQVDRREYPFDWMHPLSRRLALLISLAKDSDRILLLFEDHAAIPDLFLLMAQAYNGTVRVFSGTRRVEKDEFPDARRQYGELLLKPIQPLPEPAELYQTPNGSTVRPYQQQMIDFAKNRAGTGWFVDMGLGKTMAALVLLDYWMKHGDIDPTRPVCIVAPIMVALDTWGRECEKWGYDWDIKKNIRLTPRKRDDLLRSLTVPQEKPTLFLTNRDQLKQVREYFYARNLSLPFDVLIIDELSLFKSPTAKCSEEIAYYRQSVKRFLGLTGTPASNHLIDLWSQLKLVDKNETRWAGRTIYDFQDKFFIPGARSSQGFVTSWDPKPGAEETIFSRAADSVVSMQSKGLVELPEISYSNLFVTLPESARKEYTKLEKDIAEELMDGNGAYYPLPNGPEILIPTSDNLSGKLLQMAGGAMYTDNRHNYKVIHDEKLDALDNLIESATSPLLVFYYFASDFDRIQKRYKNTLPVLDSKDRDVQRQIARWNNGEIPVLLAHPASVGHGLNLQSGPGHTIVWFSLPNWDNDKYQQANKRLHRSGQAHSVSVIHILAKDTIEEVMLYSLRGKEKVNASLMQFLDRTRRET